MQKQGFTLIEFIAIISLMMIIATIAIPNYTEMVDKNRLKADAATAMEMGKIAEGYYAENKANATDDTKLQAYVTKIYGGEMPKPQYDKNGSFKVTLNSKGKATVSLIASGFQNTGLVLVDQGKFKEPDLDNLPAEKVATVKP